MPSFAKAICDTGAPLLPTRVFLGEEISFTFKVSSSNSKSVLSFNHSSLSNGKPLFKSI